MGKKKDDTETAPGNVTIQNDGDHPLHVLVPDADGHTTVTEIAPGDIAAVNLPEGREIRAQYRPA